MARGEPLSRAEKYAIKAMFDEGLSAKDMAKHLRRTEPFVKRYLDSEFGATEQVTKDFLVEDVEQKLFKKLRDNGMTALDAGSSINRLRRQMTARIDDVDVLYNWCVNNISVKDMMITRSEGKKKGLAIMTGAASMKEDDVKTTRKVRDTSAHIFKPHDV